MSVTNPPWVVFLLVFFFFSLSFYFVPTLMIKGAFKRQNERGKAEDVTGAAASLAFKPCGAAQQASRPCAVGVATPGGSACPGPFKDCLLHCGGCVAARAADEYCLLSLWRPLPINLHQIQMWAGADVQRLAPPSAPWRWRRGARALVTVGLI